MMQGAYPKESHVQAKLCCTVHCTKKNLKRKLDFRCPSHDEPVLDLLDHEGRMVHDKQIGQDYQICPDFRSSYTHKSEARVPQGSQKTLLGGAPKEETSTSN